MRVRLSQGITVTVGVDATNLHAISTDADLIVIPTRTEEGAALTLFIEKAEFVALIQRLGDKAPYFPIIREALALAGLGPPQS